MNDEDARARLLMLQRINERFTALENGLAVVWWIVLLLVMSEIHSGAP